MRWSTLGAVAVAVAVGCYRPTVAQNVPCGAGGACPGGQICDFDQLCRSSPLDATVADTARDASDDATSIDALLVDANVADAAPPVPWSLVQSAESTTNLCALSSTGAGHLILVGVLTNGNHVLSVTDDGGNTYVAVPQGRTDDTSDNLGAELWYAKNAHAGTAKVSISAPTVFGVVVWEVANLSTTNPLDTVATLDTQASSTMPVGAGITTTRTGEFVVAVAIAQNQITQLHANSAFTNDRQTQGNGWAHLTNNQAPAGHYVATWDQPSGGTYCATTASFFVGP